MSERAGTVPRAKITIQSLYNISVNHVTYVDLDPEDLDENGQIPNWLYKELWQDAVNEFCADTDIEIMGDDE